KCWNTDAIRYILEIKYADVWLEPIELRLVNCVQVCDDLIGKTFKLVDFYLFQKVCNGDLGVDKLRTCRGAW
ncbi:9392_t:CDS:2, partial [Funneliformis caledonium]